MSVFEEAPFNFTPLAQQVLALARSEADRLHHYFVGTEHLLLGLVQLRQGIAVTVLAKQGVDLETVRKEVEKQVEAGPDQKLTGVIPYTPRVKKVLALAAKEARALNHTYVWTEHLLLGLLREADGVAALVLASFKVDVENTRQEILRELDPNYHPTAIDSKPSGVSPDKESLNPQRDSVDTTKRYDVYCTERDQEAVYRNALFKGRKDLLKVDEHDIPSQFLEIEQADGKIVFVARSSVIKFCEHQTP